MGESASIYSIMSSSSVWADSVSHVRVVDDDIVAVRNLGVGNETEKGSDDMDMGGAYQIFWGGMSLGSDKRWTR